MIFNLTLQVQTISIMMAFHVYTGVCPRSEGIVPRLADAALIHVGKYVMIERERMRECARKILTETG